MEDRRRGSPAQARLLSLAVTRRFWAGITEVMETIMGRGDKRSRKGKIFKGSYGNSRLQRAKKAVIAAPAKGVKKA